MRTKYGSMIQDLLPGSGPDFFTKLIEHTIEFVEFATKEMRKYWAVGTGDVAK